MGNNATGMRTADIKHRKDYEKFVLENGDTTVMKLLHLWNFWNKEYFDNSFQAPPLILLAEPSRPSVLGDYSAVGAYGNRAQIRIRPSLLSGTHPHMLPGDEYRKGRFLYVADVCLHETTHVWQDEILGDLEPAYHGHGPLFRDKCNEIGARLGLPPVRTCKKRGKDAELPSCSHFPHNVRPAGYYQGAYVWENLEVRPLRGRLERLLKDYTGADIVQELQDMGVLEIRHGYRVQEEDPREALISEPTRSKHQWFLDAFGTACAAKGITPNLKLVPSLVDSLDEWITKRLSKKSFLGNKCFYDEKPHNIAK